MTRVFQKVQIEPKNDPVTVEKMHQFLKLDKEIARREHANCQNLLNLNEKMLKEYGSALSQLIQYYETCVKDVTKRNLNEDTVHSVHTFLENHYSYDEEINAKQLDLTDAEEDLLDELNRLEIAKKDLDALSKQRDDMEEENTLVKSKLSELKKGYASQDRLLASCFGEKYGSKREQMLETKLDKAIERKQRIQLSHYKWRTAKILAQYAANQLQFAINRWQEIAIVPASQIEKRYTLSSDVRNHLVCAIQNLMTSQKYLQTVTFPYCTPEEVETLHMATVHVYSDVQTVFRHAYALQCFSTTHRRIEALVKWFENIINKDMANDLTNICEQVDDLVLDIREERLAIMKKTLESSTGDDISLDDFDTEDTHSKNTYMPDIIESHISKPPEAYDDFGAKSRKVLISMMNVGDNVESGVHFIKKQHEKEKRVLEKAQRVNRARMEEGLNEKLQKRRESKLNQLQELSQSVDKSFKHLREIQPARSHDTFEETSFGSVA